MDLPECVHGARRGRSNIGYAKFHKRQPAILKADVKDCFPSIRSGAVYRMFVEQQKCSPNVARHLTRLVTLNGSLPQGSPTSPLVAVLVMVPLVERLEKLAASHGARFGQYIDDSTMSGPAHVRRLTRLVAKIISQEGLVVNRQKLESFGRDEEHVVAGVRVDHGVDVPSKKIIDYESLIMRAGSMQESGVTSLRGKIVYATRLNPECGRKLTKKLERVLSGKRV